MTNILFVFAAINVVLSLMLFFRPSILQKTIKVFERDYNMDAWVMKNRHPVSFFMLFIGILIFSQGVSSGGEFKAARRVASVTQQTVVQIGGKSYIYDSKGRFYSAENR